ncbi:NUDIX hydrolase [Eubacteriaceae bacterium ES2]|nr:NUDIX hydrolase [Eubacteriaceae bacterium ES2]
MRFDQAIMTFSSNIDEEMKNREVMLDFFKKHSDSLRRENKIAHLTGSAMIFNQDLSKTLMIHHNIYQSWGWTGGHADGQADLLEVAIKEAREETGLGKFAVLSDEIISLDILPVFSHYKNGHYISPHLHFSLCYALQADEKEPVFIKPDENSGVAWIQLNEIKNFVNESHMLPIYDKIICKVKKSCQQDYTFESR